MKTTIKWFQITARGKILWLPEKVYMKRLDRPDYRLGWIDDRHVYFCGPILLNQDQLQDLLADGWTAWLETQKDVMETLAPRGHDI